MTRSHKKEGAVRSIPVRAGLLELSGRTRGVRHIVNDTVTLGRGDACDVRLFDLSVSRTHCRLVLLPDGYLVEDLGSRAGTLLNDVPLTSATRLFDGDQISAGKVTLRFECALLRRTDQTHVSMDLAEMEAALIDADLPLDALDEPAPDEFDRLLMAGTSIPLDSAANEAQQRRLLCLLDLARRVGQQRTVEEVLDALEQGLGEIAPFRRLVIFRREAEENLRATRIRSARDDPPGHRIRVPNSLITSSMKQRRALMVQVSGEVVRVAAPLIGIDSTYGALYVELDLGADAASARDLIGTAAAETGRAIERCELESEIQYKNLKLQELTHQLSASEQRHRRLIEHAVLGVYHRTPNKGIAQANPALLRMLGDASIDALRARAASAPLRLDYDYQAFEDLIRRDGKVVGLESRWTKADGSIAYLRENAVAVYDDKGNVVGHEGTVEDITERHLAETARKEAHELLSSIVATLPVAVVGLSEDGTVGLWNPTAERIFGWTADEIIGKPYPLAPGAMSAESKTLIEQARQGQEVAGHQTSRLRKDGSAVEVEIWTSRLQEGSNLAMSIGVLADITARRQAENDYRELFEGSRDAILIFRPEDEVILEANKRAVEIYGRSREALIGMSLREMSRDVSRGRERIEVTLAQGHDVMFETVHLRPDGTEIDLEVMASVVRYGGERAILSSNRDVSDRKRLERQFLQSQKMEAMGRLAGGIAHDFNNLLTAIRGFAQLTVTKVADERAVAYAQHVLTAAGQASGLTRQLLTFSRNQVTAPRELDLNQLIIDMQDILSSMVEDHIVLRVELADDLPGVFADRSQIEQVVLNLVVNARDAMPSGGVLGLRTGGARDALILEVSDTGIGIEEDVRARMFEPFYSTKPAESGSGLGLATVYGIVTQHRGEIVCDSTPGKGTCFTVRLPLTAGELAPEVDPSADTVSPATGENRETLLVVEDDDAVRLLVCTTLSELGYQVHEASSGPAALELLEQSDLEPDGLITDVVMPGLSGPNLAIRLRERWPKLPILFMSAYFEDGHGREYIESEQFLQKPFELDDLGNAVRETLDAMGK